MLCPALASPLGAHSFEYFYFQWAEGCWLQTHTPIEGLTFKFQRSQARHTAPEALTFLQEARKLASLCGFKVYLNGDTYI